MFVFVIAAPLQLIFSLASMGRGDSTMMPSPPMANNNQLMCSGRRAMRVWWGGGLWRPKRCGGWKSNNGMTMDKQLWWQRGIDGTTTNHKQQSTNAQRQTSNNSRMWRMTAAEEMRWGWSSRHATTVCGREGWQRRWWQWQNTTINKFVVAETEDDSSWWEAGSSGGGGGATVVWQWRRNCFAIRSWRMEMEDGRGCSFFLFLARLNPTLNPTLTNPNINRAWFLGFWGGIRLCPHATSEIIQKWKIIPFLPGKVLDPIYRHMFGRIEIIGELS